MGLNAPDFLEASEKERPGIGLKPGIAPKDTRRFGSPAAALSEHITAPALEALILVVKQLLRIAKLNDQLDGLGSSVQQRFWVMCPALSAEGTVASRKHTCP